MLTVEAAEQALERIVQITDRHTQAIHSKESPVLSLEEAQALATLGTLMHRVVETNKKRRDAEINRMELKGLMALIAKHPMGQALLAGAVFEPNDEREEPEE